MHCFNFALLGAAIFAPLAPHTAFLPPDLCPGPPHALFGRGGDQIWDTQRLWGAVPGPITSSEGPWVACSSRVLRHDLTGGRSLVPPTDNLGWMIRGGRSIGPCGPPLQRQPINFDLSQGQVICGWLRVGGPRRWLQHPPHGPPPKIDAGVRSRPRTSRRSPNHPVCDDRSSLLITAHTTNTRRTASD